MGNLIDLTGQKFWMLTVTRRADNIDRYTAWYCDCDCGNKDIIVKGNDLKSNRTKSCGCTDILTKKEKDLRDWDNLYMYVKNDIMGYDNDQSLSRDMVLRLKGLLKNKFMENKKTKNTANYSFETILATFKYCYSDIQKGLKSNSFIDEQHRFNYILKIVEPKINDVYMRMKCIEKTKEEAKNTTIEVLTHTGAEYQKKTKEPINKSLNDLW